MELHLNEDGDASGMRVAYTMVLSNKTFTGPVAVGTTEFPLGMDTPELQKTAQALATSVGQLLGQRMGLLDDDYKLTTETSGALEDDEEL
jgi:hypothetical protein